MKGGALKNAVNFILYTSKYKKTINWIYLVSPQIYSELKVYNLSTHKVIIIHKSPSKSLADRKKILKIEEVIEPNIVFTLFGPAYVNY